MPIRAVLFDRDDTLSLTEQGMYMEAAQWARAQFGLEVSVTLNAMRAQWASVEGQWQHLRTLEDETHFWKGYALELGHRLGLEPEQASAMMREWPYYRFIRAVPEAREVLEALRSRGLRIGVLSNTLPNVAATLSAIEIHDLVDVAIASCTLGTHKPDPECFRLAALQPPHPPEQILFVDDRLENIVAARGLGMHALLIDHHAGTLENGAGADGEIRNLYGVLEYLVTLEPGEHAPAAGRG